MITQGDSAGEIAFEVIVAIAKELGSIAQSLAILDVLLFVFLIFCIINFFAKRQ